MRIAKFIRSRIIVILITFVRGSEDVLRYINKIGPHLNFITTMLSALMLSHAIKLDLVSFTPMVCYRSIGKPSGSLNQILDRSLWTKSVQLLATHKYRDRQYSPRSIRGSGTWVRSPFQFREYHLLIYFIFICMRWKKIV